MSPQEDGDFVDHLYEATVRPERVDALIVEWDARLAQSGDDLELRLADIRTEPFLRHVERAIAILDDLNAFEFQELDGHLAAIPSPAIVFAPGVPWWRPTRRRRRPTRSIRAARRAASLSSP